jgi:FHA domain
MSTVTKERATGRDVILAIGENMRSSLEPLVTKVIAPSRYQVYLHGDDYDRLRSLFGELESEARRHLDTELARLNRGSQPVLKRLMPVIRRKGGAAAAPAAAVPAGPPAVDAPRYVSAEGAWTVRFQEDPDGRLQPGDIQVVSEFAQPAAVGYGAGSLTRRISTTRRQGGPLKVETRTEEVPAPALAAMAAQPRAVPAPTQTEPVPAVPAAAFARIAFRDDRGPQTFWVTKDETVIGREASDVWVDLRLETSLDVSREHARLQRTPGGSFRIKDLSKLGTTVNGAAVPSSLESTGSGVRDLDVWVDLPDRARIGLAGVVFLDFERLAQE